MIKDEKRLTKKSDFLVFLAGLDRDYRWIFFPRPTMSYALNREYVDQRRFDARLRKWKKNGWIKYEFREANRVVKLTEKGELEAILEMSVAEQSKKRTWDGKWWIIMFDIPENARQVRNHLRKLLLRYGFLPIQASVYITPKEPNPYASTYLNKSGLIRYLRIARIDKLDNANEFIKKFNLATNNDGRRKRLQR